MTEQGFMRRAYHFPGFSVLVPVQTGQDVEVVPIEVPEGIPENIPQETENFKLIRIIANLALFRSDHLEEENYEEPLQEFDPPIEIRINYSKEDVRKANGDISQLKLAYWDLEKWVIISDRSHEYQVLPSSTAPIAEAKIRSWADDPILGWGT